VAPGKVGFRIMSRLARVPFSASACILVALLLVSGCGAKRDVLPPGAAGADKFLYESGMAALKDRKWIDAREYFTKLIDGYPQSSYRADAKLGMGDVYLAEGTPDSLVFAQNEFREFLTYYPTSARADYAQYKLGMTHVRAMRGPGRDQTETKEAIKELEIFVQRYPSSSLSEEVQMRLREAKDRLGQHEFGIGLTYFRQRWYPGAVARFRELLKTDPAYTNRDAVYFYLAESLRRAQNPAEALPYYERLVAEFETSQYLEDARRWISEIKKTQDKRS
jgi:outer membrane protein assembly factor BamD